MLTVRAINVNDAYQLGMHLLATNHQRRDSRNGPVLVCPEPVATRYSHPRQRVLFFPQRDANPFFHLVEALWMLSGSNDVAVPEYFVPSIAQYSDDGRTFHAAYGHRWRNHWAFDQLDSLVEHLTREPSSRRAMLGIWDPVNDLGWDRKDLPCNTTVKFHLAEINRRQALCMTVFCRSNDIIWGAYGANAVQFSVLQEYLAARLSAHTSKGIDVGWYEQVSCDYHAYADAWDKHWPAVEQYETRLPNPYLAQPIMIANLVHNAESFDAENEVCIDDIRAGRFAATDVSGWENPFFREVVQPMYQAYRLYRGLDPLAAATLLRHTADEYGEIDWLLAGHQWMMRRAAKREGQRVAPQRTEDWPAEENDTNTTAQGEQA